MLNEERIRMMFQIARYEQGAGSRDLKICKYTEKDYTAFSMIKNFFFATMTYLLLLGLMVLGNLSYWLNLLSENNLLLLLLGALIGYLVVLAFYSVLTYTIARLQYRRAARRVKLYYSMLKKLEQLYRDEAMLAGGMYEDDD